MRFLLCFFPMKFDRQNEMAKVAQMKVRKALGKGGVWAVNCEGYSWCDVQKVTHLRVCFSHQESAQGVICILLVSKHKSTALENSPFCPFENPPVSWFVLNVHTANWIYFTLKAQKTKAQWIKKDVCMCITCGVLYRKFILKKHKKDKVSFPGFIKMMINRTFQHFFHI